MSARSIARARRHALERRRRRSARTGLIGAALGSAAFAAPAEAATFTVTNTNDAGPGSLRQAVEDANLDNVSDTITFSGAGASGTITLTGEIEILTPLEIQGPGAGSLAVDGNDAGRIFYVHDLTTPAGSRNVTISGLTLRNGSDPGLDPDPGGGAIANLPGGADGADLIVKDSVLTGNESSTDGGAIYSDFGTLTVLDSVLTGNVAGAPASNEHGGAICVYDTQGIGPSDVTIIDSVVTGNRATGDGGGIYLYGIDGGLQIQRTTVSGNTAGDDGGGAVLYSDDLPPGIGGSVEASTISGNTAGGVGGGIELLGLSGPLTISNSTIAGNSTDAYGGGVWNYGQWDAPVTIRNSTIARNTAAEHGGGIAREAFDSPSFPGDDDLDLSSTIVASNTAPAGPDISNPPTPLNPISGTVSVGFSLIGNTAGNVALVESPAGSNKLDVDPQLGALASNGGPTQTLLPAITSPAIDAGIANGLTVDQRGLPRTVDQPLVPDAAGGDGTDIGAVELQDEELTGAEVKAKKKQKQKGKKVKVKLQAGAAEDVAVLGEGKVKAGRKSYALKQVTQQATAGTLAKLTLKPKKKKATRKIVRRLASGKRARANLTVTLTDAGGNSAAEKAKVTLIGKKGKKKD